MGKESRLLYITSIIQYIYLRGKSKKVLEGTPVAKEREENQQKASAAISLCVVD